MRLVNPKEIAEPAGAYSHAVEVAPSARLLFISGQIGMRPDGSVPGGVEAQAEQVWKNIEAILAEAGMRSSDLVKITALLTRAEDFPVYAAGRARYLGPSRPAATTYVVDALARSNWVVEVEAVAAKA